MLRFALSFLILLTTVWASAAQSVLFGADFESAKAIPAEEAFADAQNKLGRGMVVKGQIEKVCQSKGCWFEMRLKTGDPVRVTFKDYGFFLPKDSGGKTMEMAGLIKEKVLSVATQKHFLRDAGATEAEIAKIKDSKKVFQFEASGVRILGD